MKIFSLKYHTTPAAVRSRPMMPRMMRAVGTSPREDFSWTIVGCVGDSEVKEESEA